MMPRGGGLRQVLRFGVRQKVLLTLLLTLLVTLSVSTLPTLYAQQEEILAETSRRGSEKARLLAQYLAYSVVAHDYHTMELLLGELAKGQDIVFAKVIGSKGNVMAEVGAAGLGGTAPVLFDEAIRFDDVIVGRLQVGMSTERILQGLEHQRSKSITRQMLAILIITMVELIALSYIIIRPITTMTQALGRRRPADGHMVAPIFIASKDEFGDVAQKFNELGTELNAALLKLQSKVDLADAELQEVNARLMRQTEELTRVNTELQELTITDPLTGLHNRRHFEKLMETEVEVSIRSGDINSIVMLDVDSFKGINDQYGHDAGDLIICHVAKVIRARIRRTDVACRFGGDEFFILLRRASAENAVTIAESLRERVASQKLVIKGREVGVTLSIGVATTTAARPVRSAPEFFKNADLALYRSKESGRNRVTHWWSLPTLSPAESL